MIYLRLRATTAHDSRQSTERRNNVSTQYMQVVFLLASGGIPIR